MPESSNYWKISIVKKALLRRLSFYTSVFREVDALDDCLGYATHEVSANSNSRNGSTSKELSTEDRKKTPDACADA